MIELGHNQAKVAPRPTWATQTENNSRLGKNRAP